MGRGGYSGGKKKPTYFTPTVGSTQHMCQTMLFFVFQLLYNYLHLFVSIDATIKSWSDLS